MLGFHGFTPPPYWSLGLTGIAAAQRYTSPPANAAVKVAGKKISVDYYAPSMHGRKIIGELVAFWRSLSASGANVATGLTTEAPLPVRDVGNSPKGPGASGPSPARKEWTLIVNKQSGAASPRLRGLRGLRPHEDDAQNASPRPSKPSRIELSSTGGSTGTLQPLDLGNDRGIRPIHGFALRSSGHHTQ